MNRILAAAGGIASLCLASACADGQAPTGPQGRLNVDVAPLSLPGIADADYGIVVKNGAGDVVWQEASLTSTQYGDSAGSLTYIGTCDAGSDNTVFLTLNSLADASGTIDPTTYVNPCPAGTPCTASAKCVENEDAAIAFNLAIMRDASQGFFDVAVNFQDVFCSAKVDCNEALLFDGVVRVPTAVIGFACTSGMNSAGAMEDTTLHTDFRATWAGGGSADLHLDTSSPGNKGASPELYAVYMDSEELPGFTKGFVNAAVEVGAGVHITGQATASTGTLPAPSAGATFTSYPVIQFDVEVPAACAAWSGAVKLNAGAGVDTAYVADPSDVAYDQSIVAAPPAPPTVGATCPCWSASELGALHALGVIGCQPASFYDIPQPGVICQSEGGDYQLVALTRSDLGAPLYTCANIQTSPPLFRKFQNVAFSAWTGETPPYEFADISFEQASACIADLSAEFGVSAGP